MSDAASSAPLTIAIPKGRLQEETGKFLKTAGINLKFTERKLTAADPEGRFRAFLVKNEDLPTYVHHNIAGLGICGEDVMYESGYQFFTLLELPFGKTSMCLSGYASAGYPGDGHGEKKSLTLATKFTRFARDYYHTRGTSVSIIRLKGSVELAPVLGLAPYIVDLVETGSTLKAHNLEVLEKLKEIRVFMIANPAYYKIYYKRINELVSLLGRGGNP
ncbi:MAG: ATP phosphoribosyltransferase [Spirochaetales bacterium]|nr:MAG: ATP phosphoribosyltransferase [Spirochaetales bacterium]